MSPLLPTPAGPIGYAVHAPVDPAPAHPARPGPSAARPALALVHGWCCDRSTTAPLAELLATAGPVLSVDLRGHGDSRAVDDDFSLGAGHRAPEDAEPLPGTVRDASIEDYAEDVRLACLDAGALPGGTRPVLVGHSMGGLVALSGAAAGWAAGAVLLDPAPVLDARGRQFWADAAEHLAGDADGGWRRTFARSLFAEGDTVSRERVVDLMAGVRPALAVAGARAMAAYDGAAALQHLAVPLLVVHAGAGERGLRAAMGRPELLHEGRTVGAGHFHQLQVPEQIEPMIARWLTVTGLA